MTTGAVLIDLNARVMHVANGPPCTYPSFRSPPSTRGFMHPDIPDPPQPIKERPFARMDQPFPWPNGARCAVMLTFVFDAETLWLSRDPENIRRPGVLSQGVYGGIVGVHKVMDLMAEESLKATFFTPGWTALRYPQAVERILKEGHELGDHRYLQNGSTQTPDKEEEAMERGLDALKKVGASGRKASGRRPARPART